MLETFAVMLLAAASPVAAQAPASPQAATAKDPLDKVVCKTEDTIGSRLKAHRVCATVRDWKDQADENRLAAEKWQQQGTANPSGN